MAQSSGCDTVDNINNGIQNSVFIYKDLKDECRKLRILYGIIIIWDFFENGSVAKRLDNASGQRHCLSTLLSLKS